MDNIPHWIALYKEAAALTLLLLLVWGAARGYVFFSPERSDLIRQRDEANARATEKDKQYTAMLEKLLEVTKGWADVARRATTS